MQEKIQNWIIKMIKHTSEKTLEELYIEIGEYDYPPSGRIRVAVRLSSLLFGPTANASDADLLLKILQGDENGKNFVQTLSEVGRLPLFPQIAEQFETLKAEQEKTVEVEITSAYELTSEQQTNLAQALQKRLNREIKIQTQVDQSLIGGVLIHAGDTVIDGSVRGKLAKLAEAMNS